MLLMPRDKFWRGGSEKTFLAELLLSRWTSCLYNNLVDQVSYFTADNKSTTGPEI